MSDIDLRPKKLDLSSAMGFFSDAVRIAHEYGKVESITTTPEKTELTDLPVAFGRSKSISLYEDIPGVSLKKFYASGGTVFNEEVCEGYHKILVALEGRFRIHTSDETIIIPDKRIFFYLMDGISFKVDFLENSWFYCLSVPV